VLSPLADGSFSVLLFFTVSGFALSCIHEHNLLKHALARFPRLFLPCLCFLQLGWLLDNRTLAGFFMFPYLLLSQWYLLSEKQAPFLPPVTSFWLASRFGQTWTMLPELRGSFFLFFLADRSPTPSDAVDDSWCNYTYIDGQ